MGWSLNSLPIRECNLLERFFPAAGKALCLATAFEAKCRYVLRIANLAHHCGETGDASAMMGLATVLKDSMLRSTIKGLKGFSEIKAANIDLLAKAKDARNYIARECAGFGPLSAVGANAIDAQVARLREQVFLLAACDNIVSRWVYEIEEKETAPREIQSTYVQRGENWVFDDPYRTWQHAGAEHWLGFTRRGHSLRGLDAFA